MNEVRTTGYSLRFIVAERDFAPGGSGFPWSVSPTFTVWKSCRVVAPVGRLQENIEERLISR